MSEDLFTWTHTHGGGLATEAAAARRAYMTSDSIKGRILRDLDAQGGMTPDEFADSHSLIINTVRRRFTDLWKEGLIRHHPEKQTRKNAHGNECVVWVLGRDETVKPSLVHRLRAEIRELREQLAVLRKEAGRED